MHIFGFIDLLLAFTEREYCEGEEVELSKSVNGDFGAMSGMVSIRSIGEKPKSLNASLFVIQTSFMALLKASLA